VDHSESIIHFSALHIALNKNLPG